MKKFKIILFKNKKKKRIIKEYSKEEYAIKKFNSLLEDNNVFFERIYENNSPVEYELGLVCSGLSVQPNLFNYDIYGRWDKVFIGNSNDHVILKIDKYPIEETVFDYQSNNKVNLNFIINTYLSTDNLKVIYILNNKMVIQDEDKFNVFSLKNKSESKRLLHTIEDYFIESGRSDCLFITDESISHKKWLYDTLCKNGFNRKLLYKTKTNF